MPGFWDDMLQSSWPEGSVFDGSLEVLQEHAGRITSSPSGPSQDWSDVKKIIVGKAHGAPEHKLKTLKEAIRMAQSGEYEKVFLNRSLRTTSGYKVTSLRRPDVIGLRKLTGKLDLVEVVSPKSQTAKTMWDKLDTMKEILGDLANKRKVIE